MADHATAREVGGSAADCSQGAEERTPAPAGVQVFDALDEADSLEKSDLKRAAIGTRPSQAPAPPPAKAASEPADLAADLPVALGRYEGGVERVVARVAVVRIEPRSAPLPSLPAI